MDDLWIFDFLTFSWSEVPIDPQSSKPCPRRFHSSTLLGNQFFVIGGCHDKYRCLNDVYSLDLTPLINGGGPGSLSWTCHKPEGSGFITRWGHTSTTYDGKIYIFGGRFISDLNDLLELDLTKKCIKAVKTTP